MSTGNTNLGQPLDDTMAPPVDPATLILTQINDRLSSLENNMGQCDEQAGAMNRQDSEGQVLFFVCVFIKRKKERVCKGTGGLGNRCGDKLLQTEEQDRGNRVLFMLGTEGTRK